ncbi:hypothetical protein GW17_00005982 [Ensete ventricosum]|uniref:Uncharacterized protein n=1 Tax=Ensete ventricosum TaxID=4639 RepID=A0A444G3M9_ENSVE|nr:hypothetical protein B296_00048923 [Ensete ventricosum]RWW29500.1 hypothetical protein GW17_00005982 [Ensete ventricosum]
MRDRTLLKPLDQNARVLRERRIHLFQAKSRNRQFPALLSQPSTRVEDPWILVTRSAAITERGLREAGLVQLGEGDREGKRAPYEHERGGR